MKIIGIKQFKEAQPLLPSLSRNPATKRRDAKNAQQDAKNTLFKFHLTRSIFFL